MALARERSAQGYDPSSLDFLGFKGHHGLMLEDGGEALSSFTLESHLPSLPGPTSSPSSSFVFGALNSLPQADHWAYSSSSSSLLSFEQGDRLAHAGYQKVDHEEECDAWIDDNMDVNHLSSRCGAERRTRDASSFEMSSGHGSISATMMEYQHGEERFGLLYPSTIPIDGLQQGCEIQRALQKRPYSVGGDIQPSKKHCGNTRKAKASNKTSPSKDPQSIAAKNRRERISERLKILQELVPNGTKVDLVTMLEKAISYVKFLQLQVKVLATDEFWPAQGGKAPEFAQVKEAIDAILSSHSKCNYSSKQ